MSEPVKENKILLILAHPALERSKLNAELMVTIPASDAVTVHDLYQHYPYFSIDVAAEQALLSEHDIIVFQHPFYWYSVPALVKQWMEVVLTHGFAYGAQGAALQGKLWLNILTTGAAESSYTADGLNGMSIWELLAPLRATASLCGMCFLPPAVFYHAPLIYASQEALLAAKTNYRSMLERIQSTSVQILSGVTVENLLSWGESADT